MILDNITFDYPTSVVAIRSSFMVNYGVDMNNISSAIKAEEELTGYSTKHLKLIAYWALFALGIIIKSKMANGGGTSFETYDELYDLTSMTISLQLQNIDITLMYTSFGFFGY